jgi:uncharacterized membrane protein (GlpM family)
MRIRADLTPIKNGHWYGHVARVAIGSAFTAITGLLAHALGPVRGGLLLAFPAVFPVGLALIATVQNRAVAPHARGFRARRAAEIEATGAVTGSAGMAVFAILLWQLLPRTPASLALGAATLAWAVTAGGLWLARRARALRARRQRSSGFQKPSGADQR